jgi:dihydrofolate reductase
LVFGSHTLWNDLLAHDLVDELHLMIGPVVIGAGTPVFDGPPKASLRLIDTRKWDGSGNVLVQYEVRLFLVGTQQLNRASPNLFVGF